MKHYTIKMTALTPIHIGTGESFDPTNFVIDDGYLYEFDEIEFFKNLDLQQKEEFLKAVEQKREESLFQIHRVIKQNKEIAKKNAKHKTKVSSGIQNDYDRKIGQAVQIEGGRKIDKRKIFNQFEIEKTARQANKNHILYLPGSSIKGAISTAYQEFIYKKDPRLWQELFENRNPSLRVFKNLSVADTKLLKAYSIIGYALNKERFECEDHEGPKTKLEVIFSNLKQQSRFETTLTFKDYEVSRNYKVTLEELVKACNEHYFPIFKQMFESYTTFKGRRVDDCTNEYFSEEFYERYNNFQLKDNQFLLRVGKHSQARAVTIDGMRRIEVKVSGGGPRRKPNRWETLDQETTTWFFGFKENQNEGLLPFGWILCEIIEKGNQ